MAREMPKDRALVKAAPRAPVDLETRARTDHHLSLRLWLRILSCTKPIESHIRQNLTAKFNTTLPRFDLMAQLERSPGGLTMSDLSQRMMVTGGNVTRIVDGLENEGLVIREVDSADRRVVYVRLASNGRRQFHRMASEHERWIIELFDDLSQRKQQRLSDLLHELKSVIGAQREE